MSESDGVALVDRVDRVDMAAKNRAEPKTKPPGRREKYVSRYRAGSADRAGHVHPVHGVHPHDADQSPNQLTAKHREGSGDG